MEEADFDPRLDVHVNARIGAVKTGEAFVQHVQQCFPDSKQGLPGLEAAIAAFGRVPFDEMVARASQYATTEDWAVRLRRVRSGDVLSVSPRNCLWLLANSFFCNIASVSGCGSLDWRNLFGTMQEVGVERLLCLFDYLSRAHEHLDDRAAVEFERVAFKEWPWDNEAKATASHVVLHGGAMEEYSGDKGGAFVDFANKRLQIHRIIPSATQEEVLFSACSELFLCLVCFEVLAEDEAVCVRNVWRHCSYSGYLDTFKFKGSISEMEEVLAIDALTNQHFQRSVIDSKKCYAAFSTCRRGSISTSKWGCGVFMGTCAHKFVQQLLAAQLAGKTLCYASFHNDEELAEYREIARLIDLKQPTFGWLLTQMTTYRDMPKNYFRLLCKALSEL